MRGSTTANVPITMTALITPKTTFRRPPRLRFGLAGAPSGVSMLLVTLPR
jgi:hypothetical protein